MTKCFMKRRRLMCSELRLFQRIVGVLLLFVVVVVPATNIVWPFLEDKSEIKVRAAIITELNVLRSSAKRMRYERVHEFASTFFANANINIEIEEWPAVFTANCPHDVVTREKRDEFDPVALDEPGSSATVAGKLLKRDGATRGLFIAHKEVWSSFIFEVEKELSLERNNNVNNRVTKHLLIVFEDDVVCLKQDNCPEEVLKELRAMTTDVLFMGYCFSPERHGPPLCLHAYVLTYGAAKKLVKEMDSCGEVLDLQMRTYGESGGYTWATTQYQASPEELKYLREKDDVSFDQCEGLFGQASHGQNKYPFKEGSIIKPFDSTTLYLVQNDTLHEFPTWNTFVAMGYDVDMQTIVYTCELMQIRIGSQLPVLGNCPNYTENSLVQVRGRRPMYLIRNGLRQELPCWNYVFTFQLDVNAMQTFEDSYLLFEKCFPAEAVPLERAGVCYRRRKRRQK